MIARLASWKADSCSVVQSNLYLFCNRRVSGSISVEYLCMYILKYCTVAQNDFNSCLFLGDAARLIASILAGSGFSVLLVTICPRIRSSCCRKWALSMLI